MSGEMGCASTNRQFADLPRLERALNFRGYTPSICEKLYVNGRSGAMSQAIPGRLM